MKVKSRFAWILIFFSFLSTAKAGILDFNYIDPNNLGALLPQDVANEAIKMFGIYTCHRPYSGATSITHSNTLDLNVEATLVKLGDGLVKALNANNVNVSQQNLPAVPWAAINLRKGFNDSFDLGISFTSYKGQTVIGGDFKFVLHDAEEGPSYALRLGYTHISVPYAYVTSGSVINPEFVVSQRLDFAESYIGAGFRYITGTLTVPGIVTVKGPGGTSVSQNFTLTKDGSGTDQYLFTGVYFRILGSQGLRLGIEGAFDFSGYHTLGGVFGIGF